MSNQNETARYWRFIGEDNMCYATNAVYREVVELSRDDRFEVKYSRAQSSDFIPWTPTPRDWVTCPASGVESMIRSAANGVINTSSGTYTEDMIRPCLHRAPASPAPAPVAHSQAISAIDRMLAKTADSVVGSPAQNAECAADNAVQVQGATVATPDYIGASARHTAAMLERQRVAGLAPSHARTAADDGGLYARGRRDGARIDAERALAHYTAALKKLDGVPVKPTPWTPKPVRCGIWSREI